jgi:hypothetical protein
MTRLTHAQEIENATDADLADACTKIVLCWGIPIAQPDVEAIQSIVVNFEETGSMPGDARKRLIAILLRLLAPASN